MIRHILADGREVDSVEGMVVPAEGATAAVYRIVAEFARSHSEIIYQNMEDKADATA